MDTQASLKVTAEVRVERGTATHCACGSLLVELPRDLWWCPDCGREYA